LLSSSAVSWVSWAVSGATRRTSTRSAALIINVIYVFCVSIKQLIYSRISKISGESNNKFFKAVGFGLSGIPS